MVQQLLSPEYAQLWVATASAIMQAVQTWVDLKDSDQASIARAETYARATSNPSKEELEAVEFLVTIVPAPVAQRLIERTNECFENYQTVLDGRYLPKEIDDATDAVKECVCRELRRIYSLNGSIPPGITLQWWNQWCADQT